jgi:hypothetical protein
LFEDIADEIGTTSQMFLDEIHLFPLEKLSPTLWRIGALQREGQKSTN